MMALELTIGPALTTDAQSVGNLAQQFAGYLRSLGDQSELNLNAEKYLRDGFGHRSAFAELVAETNNSVFGYLLYHFGYDSDAATANFRIVDLYIDAKARKQGAGRALMSKAASIARHAGAREMIWSVYHGNKIATKFYENLGARRISDVFFMKLRADAL
jgi:ribosomal protein S18 acetylase RimI-like enzyme